MSTQTGRKAWETERRRPNPDAVLRARNAVSTRAGIYGTERQIQSALGELDAAWTAEADKVEEANRTARAILPGFGERLRSRGDADTYQSALEALTDPLRHLVEHAERLQENRRLIALWNTALMAGRLGDGGEVPAVLDDTARFPVASVLFGRLTTARNAAVVQALRDAEATPIGDVAWIAAQQAEAVSP